MGLMEALPPSTCDFQANAYTDIWEAKTGWGVWRMIREGFMDPPLRGVSGVRLTQPGKGRSFHLE